MSAQDPSVRSFQRLYVERDIDSNVNSPSIHDFPVEILVYIFTLVSEPRPNHEDLTGYLEWVPAVTHVCRHWRSIAISRPLLWSAIVHTGRKQDCFWLPIMLERAAGAPLDVCIDMPGWDDTMSSQTVRETLELLLPHSPTFRSVWFSFDYFPDDEYLLPLVSRIVAQTTDVVDLHLIHEGVEWASSPLQFDAIAFNMSGRLRHLVLESVFLLPWSSAAYTSLHTLTLKCIKSPPQIDEFLGILRACPELEHLSIQDCDFPVSQKALSESVTVALPHMQDIHLAGRSRVISHLVDRIEASPACKNITINSRLHHEDGMDAAEVYYSHLSPSAPLYRSLLPHCELLTVYAGSLDIQASLAVRGLDDEYLMSLSIMPDRFELPPFNPAAWTQWLRPFANLSERSLIRRFTILYPIDSHFTEDMWVAALASFPCLEHLQLEFTATLAEALPIDNTHVLCVTAALQRTSDTGPCTPRLRKLGFASVAIDDAVVEPLVQMIKWRAERDAPLSELILESDSPSHGHETLVRNLQEKVKVLGIRVSSTCV